jgi:hypothetical protein
MISGAAECGEALRSQSAGWFPFLRPDNMDVARVTAKGHMTRATGSEDLVLLLVPLTAQYR